MTRLDRVKPRITGFSDYDLRMLPLTDASQPSRSGCQWFNPTINDIVARRAIQLSPFSSYGLAQLVEGVCFTTSREHQTVTAFFFAFYRYTIEDPPLGRVCGSVGTAYAYCAVLPLTALAGDGRRFVIH